MQFKKLEMPILVDRRFIEECQRIMGAEEMSASLSRVKRRIRNGQYRVVSRGQEEEMFYKAPGVPVDLNLLQSEAKAIIAGKRKAKPYSQLKKEFGVD